jgi:SRSO17 transposase
VFLQAGKYLGAVMSDIPERNGWSIARFSGDGTPDRTQRLLNHASWDASAAMGVVRRFGAAGLEAAARRHGRRKGRLKVLALDETGQEKKGEKTAGVKRQHMGCAGGVENGVNVVHAAWIREGTGQVLAGFRQRIPEEHVKDPVKSLVTALPLDLRFKTKGELAIGIFDDAVADGLVPDFVCGDETSDAVKLSSIWRRFLVRLRSCWRPGWGMRLPRRSAGRWRGSGGGSRAGG